MFIKFNKTIQLLDYISSYYKEQEVVTLIVNLGRSSHAKFTSDPTSKLLNK